MFSKACEYGIRAAIYVAERSMLSEKVSLKQVAAAIDSPEAYTSKILQQLCKAGIIISAKGPKGGFYMDGILLETVKLSAVVSTIDGDSIYKGCGLGLKACNNERPCPVHFDFMAIRESLRNMLETTTIKSLAERLQEGISFLRH